MNYFDVCAFPVWTLLGFQGKCKRIAKDCVRDEDDLDGEAQAVYW